MACGGCKEDLRPAAINSQTNTKHIWTKANAVSLGEKNTVWEHGNVFYQHTERIGNHCNIYVIIIKSLFNTTILMLTPFAQLLCTLLFNCTCWMQYSSWIAPVPWPPHAPVTWCRQGQRMHTIASLTLANRHRYPAHRGVWVCAGRWQAHICSHTHKTHTKTQHLHSIQLEDQHIFTHIKPDSISKACVVFVYSPAPSHTAVRQPEGAK